jgi:hypothetical protein
MNSTAGKSCTPYKLWSEYREASLSWLALGVLLAAWNASDNDASPTLNARPSALRSYPSVSVRAALKFSAGG